MAVALYWDFSNHQRASHVLKAWIINEGKPIKKKWSVSKQ